MRVYLTSLLLLLTVISFAQTDTSHNNLQPPQMTTPANTGSSLSVAIDTSTTTVKAKLPTTNIGSISGRIVDAKDNPVSYATVTLLRKDSTVVNGDLSKDDGSFSIKPTGTGDFVLRIESIGVATKNMDIDIAADNPNKSLGDVKITTAQNTLKTVTVTGEKPLMEMKVDKKVFNVEKNITSAGGSATDVLSNVPAVSVDVDGNVSLRNKANVTVLIDGKPSTLLGQDQASALQSLPAASIESVEVITNPSAKYDAQGPTGIINIVTKKSTAFGFNGTATAGAGTGDKYNGSLNLNFHKGSWNVFLNSSARFNSNYNNTTTDITPLLPGELISPSHSFEHAQRHFDAVFNSVGASYDINKNNSITFTQNVNVMQFNVVDTSRYLKYAGEDESGPPNSLQQRYSTGHGGPVSYSSALDYKGKFKKKGEEISVDATYAHTSFVRTQDYLTDLNNYQYNLLTPNVYETSPTNATNQTFTGWADYTDPLFTKNGKLGLGVKTQLYWFTSHNSPYIDTNGGTHYTDTALLNNFNYTQQIHAGYINWNDQIGKFSYQAGLRAEYENYQGYDYVLSSAPYTHNFFDLFPSAFVSYQLPNQQSIYLNYSRRTNRPNFFQLLPYKNLTNPAVVSEGNPNLVPEFIHNIEFAYTKATNRGDNFIVSMYYTYTQNLTETVTRPVDTADRLPQSFANAQFQQPINLKSGQTYGLELTGHIQILPIWDATLDFNFFQNQIDTGNLPASYASYVTGNSGFSWFGKINTNIKLPKQFSVQLNGNYESAKPIAQGTLKEVYWLDVAVKKSFWKNKLSLVLNCSDVFNTRKYTTDYNLSAYHEVSYRDRETRVGQFTVTYRFGKVPGQGGGPSGRKGKGNNNNQQNQQDREQNLKQGDDDQGGGGLGTGGGGGQGGNGSGGGGSQGGGTR
jgi:iron complex outermembrane recepter protein